VYRESELSQASIRDQYLIAQIEREIAAIVGVDNVNTDAALLHEQSADWSWISQYLRYKSLPVPTADLYVRPGTAEEVAEVLRVASEYKIPVVPRGGGSGTQGGTFAIYGGIAMDLRRLNKVLHIDEVSMVVTAEAGIEGPELEKVLNAKGLTMPHYPGSFHFGATLGGFLAARGSGVVLKPLYLQENSLRP
jgi:alkyldihydroxyacetonephosphate synthase